MVTAAAGSIRFHRRERPLGLGAAAVVVAALLASPLVFLLVEAAATGPAGLARLVFRSLTGELVWNTVRLAVVVMACCAVLGTAAAFLTERTDLPWRRPIAVLLVVPLAIPDFVVSFGWSSLSTAISGFLGAVLVMTLAVYPLVYLPVAAALRNADPAQEEVARSLGHGPARTFFAVTLGQVRGALLGGCLLVGLVLLAEYGAFEILGYQTFTTEIFTELQLSFDVKSASALALVLVALSLVFLLGEAAARGRGRAHHAGTLAKRPAHRRRLGRATLPALLAAVALIGLAVGVPVGTCVYWMAVGSKVPLGGVSLLSATAQTAQYAAGAGIVATGLAVPVALLALRHRGRLTMLLERSTYLVLALPGLVVALALSTFSERYASGFGYQSAGLLVLAYAILFFPLALVGVRASLAQAPPRLEEVARSLGTRRAAVFARVTVPLVVPGLAAAFSLVFLSVVTELTATLLLVPSGVATLATQFWAYQQNLSNAQAAPFALVMMGLAAVPSVLIGRYFDRLRARQEVAQ